MATPLIAAGIWTFIIAILSHLLTKAVFALGIGIIVYSGLELGIAAVQTYVENQWGGLPAYMLQLIGMLQLDTAIAIILAAYTARVTVQFINGVFTKFQVSNSVGSIWQ